MPRSGIAGYRFDDVMIWDHADDVTGTADRVAHNRAAWDRWAGEYCGSELTYQGGNRAQLGIWNIGQATTGVLRADLAGRDGRVLRGSGGATRKGSNWLDSAMAKGQSQPGL